MKSILLGAPLGLLALLVSPSTQDGSLPTSPDPAITARELRHHVAYLASDELRGREAGTPYAVRAAQYLARALEAAGAKPAGDDGRYLQAVPLTQTTHAGPPVLELELASGELVSLVSGIGFNLSIRGVPSPTDWLPVRMVRSAEDLAAPESAEEALFLAGSRRENEAWLEAHGRSSSEGWGLTLSTGSSSEGRRVSTPRAGRLTVQSDEPDPCDGAKLRGAAIELLEAGDVARIRLVYDAKTLGIVDYNVVGRIDGVGTADEPELAREAIVFSAHYDHVGTSGDPDATDEDVIFNGADDDASGTAAVLEIAQAIAAGDPPARTCVFLLAAGEEKGLLGTRYYIDHPVVPLADTVCNLNFEMVGRPDELAGGAGKLWLTGFERSTLGPRFQDAGLAVIPDPRPDQNFFQRSDNYAFAVRGIVAQTLSSYNLHEDYHQVTDEVELLDFEHMQAALRDAYAAARFLIDGSLSPEWLPGGKPEPRGSR